MLKLKTASGRWDRLCDQILGFLQHDITELVVDGQRVRGFRSPDNPALWIRDHSDILRGGKYMEKDLRTAVDCFAMSQGANGRIFDYILTEPLARSNERENWEKWVRIQVEADVEYRYVKAAYLTWQATGDSEWIRGLLPSLDSALNYTLQHPWRWDQGHGLVKRAYTIDTWDFDYTAGRHPWLNFQITDHTYWGISHADNSGLYEAALLLADLHELHQGMSAARRWRVLAAELRARANALLFNGRFYTHFHKLSPVQVAGINEAEQLSLSTPMAINRGLATPSIASAILQEYKERQAKTGAFAAWFSIDPPFPTGIFGEDKLVAGAYINGGIFPLAGGELAKAAFENGEERYGVEQLERYAELIQASNETYLWYFPDGTASSKETSTSPDAMPTDGWGASSMLYALVEGLAGIQDRGHSFKKVRLSPRWSAADENETSIDAAYAPSGAGFGYDYVYDQANARIRLELRAPNAEVDLNLLLPDGLIVKKLTWDETPVSFAISKTGESRYVVSAGKVKTNASISIQCEQT